MPARSPRPHLPPAQPHKLPAPRAGRGCDELDLDPNRIRGRLTLRLRARYSRKYSLTAVTSRSPLAWLRTIAYVGVSSGNAHLTSSLYHLEDAGQQAGQHYMPFDANGLHHCMQLDRKALPARTLWVGWGVKLVVCACARWEATGGAGRAGSLAPPAPLEEARSAPAAAPALGPARASGTPNRLRKASCSSRRAPPPPPHPPTAPPPAGKSCHRAQ